MGPRKTPASRTRVTIPSEDEGSPSPKRARQQSPQRRTPTPAVKSRGRPKKKPRTPSANISPPPRASTASPRRQGRSLPADTTNSPVSGLRSPSQSPRRNLFASTPATKRAARALEISSEESEANSPSPIATQTPTKKKRQRLTLVMPRKTLPKPKSPSKTTAIKSSRKSVPAARKSLAKKTPKTIGVEEIRNELNSTSFRNRYRAPRTVRNILEIQYYQRIVDNLVPKLPFARLCAEISAYVSNCTSLRWKKTALEALQEAAEHYVTHFLEDSNLLARHAKRVTLMRQDMELAFRIRRDDDKF